MIQNFQLGLRQRIVDFANLIYTYKDPTDKIYVYNLDPLRNETSFNVTRILKHRNSHLKYYNQELFGGNDSTDKKWTDTKEWHIVTLFLEMQGNLLKFPSF